MHIEACGSYSTIFLFQVEDTTKNLKELRLC